MIELQAIANVKEQDVAQAISEMEGHEVSDLFLSVVEKMNDIESIAKIIERLIIHCKKTIT